MSIYRFTHTGSAQGLRGSMGVIARLGPEEFGRRTWTRQDLVRWWTRRVAEGTAAPIAPRTWETVVSRMFTRGLIERMDRMGRWERAEVFAPGLSPASLPGTAVQTLEEVPTGEADEPDLDQVAQLLGVDPRTGKKAGKGGD